MVSARDSLFQTFYRARDLYAASQHLTTYAIAEPPLPPQRMEVRGEAEHIALSWVAAPGTPAPAAWEVFRTSGWVDDLFASGCLDDTSLRCGYEQIGTLPGGASTILDTTAAPNTDHYYYIQVIGAPQPVGPRAITGTPGGQPLRSGRYLAQTWLPATRKDPTAARTWLPATLALSPVAPNPVRDEAAIRFTLVEPSAVTVGVYDALGRRVAVLTEGHRAAGSHKLCSVPLDWHPAFTWWC